MMLIKTSRYALTLLMIGVVLLTGCPSTKQSVKFAEAGTTYAAALDSLLVATQTIVIDSNSEQILEDRTDAIRRHRPIPNYERVSKGDEELIKTIGQLRVHTQLLARYFGLLYELGTSDSPERAEAAIGDEKKGLIGSINKVSNQLRGSSLITGAVATVSGSITNLIVKASIRKALKDELEERGPMIQRELRLQETLFKALSTRITQSLEVSKQVRERRLIVDPYESTTAVVKPEDWIANRRSLLTQKLTADQLEKAGDAIKDLRRAYADLGSNKASLARFDTIIAEFETLLTIAEKLKA